VRHIRFAFSTLSEECVSEVRNCCGQQFSVVFLRRQEDKVDETFGHHRRQVGNIDVLLALYVFPNHLIDFAVQTVLRCAFVFWHDLNSPMQRNNSVKVYVFVPVLGAIRAWRPRVAIPLSSLMPNETVESARFGKEN
jgi:hypothetical protein